MKKGLNIDIALPRIVIVTVVVLVCSLASQLSSAQTAITSFTTSTVSGATSTDVVVIPSDATNSIFDDRGENATINYGTGLDVRVDSYTVFGSTFNRFLLPDTLVLNRRQANDRLVTIWYEISSIVDNTPPTNNIINVDPAAAADADAIYQTLALNAGYDNILVNNDDLSDNPVIQVETERVDVIWFQGIQTSSPTTAIFPIIERGGNDNVAVAAITSLNADGTPASYGTLLGIGETAWTGGNAYTVDEFMIFRRETAGSDPLPLGDIGPQNIEGMAITLDNLGISANQSIFGYSIFAADVVNGFVSGSSLTTGSATIAGGIDLTDISTFPSGTLSSDSGMDLIAGVSAAVASDDNLIETKGPGGYKSALATWLKANEAADVTTSTEGSTVTDWQDHWIGNHDFTTGIAGAAPTYRSTTTPINFNPTVDFTASSTSLSTANNNDFNDTEPYTNKGINIAFRTSTSDIATRQVLFEQGGNTRGINIYIRGSAIHVSAWNRSNDGAGSPWNDSGNITTVSASVSTNTEYIVTLEENGNSSSTGTITAYLNGQSIGVISNIGLLYRHTGGIELGGNDGNTRFDDGSNSSVNSFFGEISEFIYCNEPGSFPLAQRQRIESYLAIKYGITLDQSSPVNYVNSDGIVIFDATNSAGIGGFLEYNNDIAGIGRDDASELDQPASKSENTGSVVTIDKGSSITSDDTWLVWGNDGTALTETGALTMPDTIQMRLTRVWRAAETNEVGNTSVSFDITGLSLSTDENDFSLLIAGNGTNADFSTATVVTGGTLVGNILTFTGVDIDDAEFFTLGTQYFQCGPGGVFDNLALWLKANDGPDTEVDAANLATWSDRSGNGNDATVNTNAPNYAATSMNFNAAVNFDDTNSEEITGTAGFHSVAYYMVANPDVSHTSNANEEDVIIGFGAPAGATDEFGGFGLGEMTSGLTNEVVTHAIGGTTIRWRRGISSANVSQIDANRTYLFGVRDNAVSATSNFVYIDGQELSNIDNTGEGSAAFLTSVDQDYEVGSYTSANAFATGNHFDGQISEIISYSVRPTDAEHNRIQSYLAVKYGITLDQTVATNYLAADGGTVWNATDNSSYANDIAGIGRDDLSCLNQLQSQSQNTGSIVTMGLGEIAANNAANPNSFSTDDSFLMWGNDGASATEANAVAYAEDVVTERMLRIWRADENAGTVGNTDISFDLTGLGYTGSLSDYSLIISDAAGLTTPTIVPAVSFTSDVVTFANVDLTDGQYFTLGTQRTACGPGGITTDLYMWLRADAGTSTTSDGASLTTWTDQSGNSTNATEATFPPTFRNNSTQNINFNPTIDFDGTDDLLNLGNLTNIKSGATNGGDYTIVGVGIRDDGDYNFVVGSAGGTSNQDLHFGYRNNDSQATLAHWGNDLNVTTTGFASPTAPFLLFGEYDGATGRVIEETRDGGYARSTDANSTDISGSQTNYIGNVESIGNYNGLIPEVIIYDNDITDLAKQQVISYLAIKYGITLTNNNNNNGSTNEIISGSVREGDYLATNGAGGTNVVWTYANNSAYHNDVAGIGRDDDGCFAQKQSRAEDTDDILTIGLGAVAADNASNANGFNDNGDYLVWGNDNGSTLSANANTSDVPGIVTERMERIWKVQDTGTVGATELQFDLTGTSFPTGDASAYSLLVGSTATMADATIVTGGSFNGSVLSFSGIDLTDGQFFTIGTAVATCGPGGVSTSLALWLRADVEVFSDAGSTAATDGGNVLQWNDQSSPAENGSEIDLGGGSPIEPTFETNEVNFNPTLRFVDPNSGNASYIETSSNTATTDMTMISVFSTGQAAGSANDFINSPALVSGRTSTATDADFGMGMENGTIYVNASSTDGFDAETSSTFNDNAFHFATSTRVSSSGAITVFVDSNQETTGTGSTGALSAPTSLGIGNHSDSDLQAQYAGDIAETIVFSSVLTSEERNQVESYLALKYGITKNSADDGGTGSVDERDYRAGDGGVTWDYDGQGATYYNDIFGIGRDDLSCFDQVQSKSENSDALVTFNNTGGFGDDDSFLISGNDNAAIEAENNNERPASIASRLNREWRVQETGTVGTIELTYDLSSITGPTGIGTNNLNLIRLMVDDDGDFSSGPTTLISPSSIDGTNKTVTFTVDFTNGQYYTLGSEEIAALPVTLLSFTAESVDNEHIQINWSTISEDNNAYFTVERSSDAQTFEVIGAREGAGSSTDIQYYQFIDNTPLSGVSYYRLRQTDFNGESEYSELRKVTFSQPEADYQFKVYPNPVASGETVKLGYQVQQNQEAYVSLITSNGMVTEQFSTTLMAGENQLVLPISTLPKGLHFLRVLTVDGKTTTLKLIIQ